MPKLLCFGLADITVAFQINHKSLESKISPDLMRLQSDSEPNIRLEVSYEQRKKIPIEDIPGPYPHRLPFLWRPRTIQCYLFSSSPRIENCYGVVKLDESLNKGYFLIDKEWSFPDRRPPLDVPLLFILLGQILPGKVISLHSTGVLDKMTGKGMLFAGLSETGKTTIANLWEKEGAMVLGEEQIIIRKTGRKLWGYPYPGLNGQESEPCSKMTICPICPEKIMLDSIFLLNHAPQNNLIYLPREEIIHRLFNLARFASTTYPPCAEDLLDAYAFINDIIQTIPVYELGFVPDRKVIDFVRKHLTAESYKGQTPCAKKE